MNDWILDFGFWSYIYIYMYCICVAYVLLPGPYMHCMAHLIILTSCSVIALTLIDVKEGLPQLAREKRLRKVSEKLLHHVGHIIGRLVLVVDVFWGALIHLPQSQNPGFYSRLPEQPNLVGRTWLVEVHICI